MRLRKLVAYGLALFAFLFVIGALHTGCFPETKSVAAAVGYEAQQMRCVEQYADKPSIDRCRNRVKAAWATDAGKDADHD